MVNHIRISRAMKRAMKSEPDPRDDIGILMGLAFNALATELRAYLAEAGYDDIPKSFGYIARNISHDHLTLSALAQRLGITSPGALKLVQEMVATGYLERISDPKDARVKRHRLTRRGQNALAAARSFHETFEAALAKRIGAAKTKTFREALVEIVREYEETTKTPLAIRPM